MMCHVALKLLPAAFTSDGDRRARFGREARAAAALSHPNICTLYKVGDADSRLYIAMEHLEAAKAHGELPKYLEAPLAKLRKDLSM